ncbi:MAG: type II 3-dehydroquinate dehydratase [Chloroflexi bacterium]|jgi:3-dehydroquinate dehydratase-2|nr:type II 3-dehydroquinate dehydratase [Chloroflexota bacterium]|tara:strand:- start:1664 stop:2101 length:438 start_codon:yes stop_codon:yes gene_type:complete
MKLLIINGPNLNLLGKRDRSLYGSLGLDEIENKLNSEAEKLKINIEFFQSNHEGNIVDFLQSNSLNSDGIIINPGALTHYGISLRDGLLDSKLPIIEVHLSNIHSREEFRNRSVVSDISVGQIVGLGWQGYIYALNFLKYYIDTK